MKRDAVIRRRSVAPRSGKPVEKAPEEQVRMLSEPYNFERDWKISLADEFLVEGPYIDSKGLIELSKLGIASPFMTTAHQPVSVTGQIVLDASGRPDPEKSDFTWRDLKQ